MHISNTTNTFGVLRVGITVCNIFIQSLIMFRNLQDWCWPKMLITSNYIRNVADVIKKSTRNIFQNSDFSVIVTFRFFSGIWVQIWDMYGIWEGDRSIIPAYSNTMIQFMSCRSEVSPYQWLKMFLELKNSCCFLKHLRSASTQWNFITQLKIFTRYGDFKISIWNEYFLRNPV